MIKISKKEGLTQEAFDLIRNINIFCDCALVGSAKHIEIMKKLIQADPKRLISRGLFY